MSLLGGIGFLLVLFLLGMDIVFDRIPSCVKNGVEVDGSSCIEEYKDYAELTFYDPTLPEPQRWDASNILLMFGHPTVKKIPVTWFTWRVGWREEPVDVWSYHNELPTLTNNRYPLLDPPIRLSDGSFASSLSQLEQVQTR